VFRIIIPYMTAVAVAIAAPNLTRFSFVLEIVSAFTGTEFSQSQEHGICQDTSTRVVLFGSEHRPDQDGYGCYVPNANIEVSKRV